MKKTLVIAALCATVTGCGSISNPIGGYKNGTEVTAEQAAVFSRGKSTAADVRASLGAPQSQEQVGDDLHYIYNYSEINHFSPNKNESTRFIFGKGGKLKDVQKGKGNTSNPLLGD
ncbi:hypothetical protein [Microbulbifer discodermiae]|uniref:hypothetical protein n=1 Tax=Microbulbifer sp. 2201CG32-9 TaxID=3232309 RepID=UPI00345BF9FF